MLYSSGCLIQLNFPFQFSFVKVAGDRRTASDSTLAVCQRSHTHEGVCQKKFTMDGRCSEAGLREGCVHSAGATAKAETGGHLSVKPRYYGIKTRSQPEVVRGL